MFDAGRWTLDAGYWMLDNPFHKYVLGQQTKRAKGDPVPTFLHIFYSNDVVGTRRLKPAEDPASRHSFKNIIVKSGEEAVAVLFFRKIMKLERYVLKFSCLRENPW